MPPLTNYLSERERRTLLLSFGTCHTRPEVFRTRRVLKDLFQCLRTNFVKIMKIDLKIGVFQSNLIFSVKIFNSVVLED